jgi:RNA polymerase sigma factor (sigma-70 family)
MLYRTGAANAFRRARQLLNDDAEAHEVIHDVFLSVFERPEQHQGRSSMNTFLYGAVTNACLNRIRARKNRSRLLELHAQSVPSPAPLLAADQSVQLRMLLERLPEPLADVAIYSFMDGLTHDEIARVMRCSRRHVGALLERLTRWVQAQKKAECG